MVRVICLEIRRFRGFKSLRLLPAGHVALVGEPSAGRSDVIEALERVLSPEAVRTKVPTDLDFYRRDKRHRAEVEVVLGELGEQLEQDFFDHLELWDRETNVIVDDLGDPELIDREQYDLVVRFCYRIEWNAVEDLPEHWVDYPKSSDPESGTLDRVPRAHRELIAFAGRIGGRPLDLSSRGVFRRLVEVTDGGDFAPALESLEERIGEVASTFSHTAQVSNVLERVLDPVRIPLGVGTRAAADVFQFLPEGGSLAGLLRTLAPALDLQDEVGALPLFRHGSTVSAMLTIAQAMVAMGEHGVVAVPSVPT